MADIAVELRATPPTPRLRLVTAALPSYVWRGAEAEQDAAVLTYDYDGLTD